MTFRDQLQDVPYTMAPLSHRDELSTSAISAIITLSIIVVCGAFCAIVFCVMCRQQRRRAKAVRKLQEEYSPFIGRYYTVPADPQSNPTVPQYPQEPLVQQHYDGPMELQGSGRPVPQAPQQLDGYAVVVCLFSVKT